MPYTPPSHRSPAPTASSSPDASRRSSFQTAPRPNLPRSASSLNKNRRTPSSPKDTRAVPLVSTNGAVDMKMMALKDLGGSVRQSPPPRPDANELIPKCAVISPPDSTASCSDDDEPLQVISRRPDILRDLREAVGKISKQTTPPSQPAQPIITIPPILHTSCSTSVLDDAPLVVGRGRRHGHTRRATDPNVAALNKSDNSPALSDEDTDEDLKSKPQMVRKKSGELVRPALRGRRRPSSMPGTPLFSKAVHFDSHLEHVRHFLQVDRPLAVSAGSSPAEVHENEHEYPFPTSNSCSQMSPPFEWELMTPNFPHDSLIRKSMPARVERVWLSNDQKSLFGSVVVANLAFSKSVVCRFTLDYWKTISEVNAEYSHEIRPHESSVGQDRFTFTIQLSDMADLESKTLFFCVRYTVNGQEYWDNNDSTNFQVDFRKKSLPQNGKNRFQGLTAKPASGLPRSNRRQRGRSTTIRPLPTTPATNLDAFGNGNGALNFERPIHEFLGDSEPVGGLRFKSKSSSALASDNIAMDLVSPSGIIFSNRYDFSASLDAAVKAAKNTTSGQPRAKEQDTLYMKKSFQDSTLFRPAIDSADTSTGMSSPAPSLPSASYEELVNKYCFFGSAAKQSSPIMRDATFKEGTLDGQNWQEPREAGDHKMITIPISPAGSPVRHQKHAGGASHHSMYYASMNPYFQAINANQNAKYSTGCSPSQQESCTAGLSSSRGCTTPPSLVSGSGTPGSDTMTERFPWTADAHSAPAIQS